MKRYVSKLKESDFYSIMVSVDRDNIKTDIIEKKLNNIIGWDGYDKDEKGDWIQYSFTKFDFNKIKKIFNLKDTENFIVEKI
jgi:hypothetical protein